MTTYAHGGDMRDIADMVNGENMLKDHMRRPHLKPKDRAELAGRLHGMTVRRLERAGFSPERARTQVSSVWRYSRMRPFVPEGR